MVTYKTNFRNGHFLVYGMAGIFALLVVLTFVSCAQKQSKNDTDASPQTAVTINTDSIPSLQAQLDERTNAMLTQIPNEVKNIMTESEQQILETGILDKALHIGDTIFSFSLPDANNNSVSSDMLLKQGPIIVTFYRGGWCPFCNMQLAAYENILPQIHALGAQLVAISPEQPDSSLSTVERQKIHFVVLSDNENQVAKQFNIVYDLPDQLIEIYKQFKLDIPAYNNTDRYELPLGATYIVDTKGIITYAFVDIDYKKRAEPETLLKELAKLSK